MCKVTNSLLCGLLLTTAVWSRRFLPMPRPGPREHLPHVARDATAPNDALFIDVSDSTSWRKTKCLVANYGVVGEACLLAPFHLFEVVLKFEN